MTELKVMMFGSVLVSDLLTDMFTTGLNLSTTTAGQSILCVVFHEKLYALNHSMTCSVIPSPNNWNVPLWPSSRIELQELSARKQLSIQLPQMAGQKLP